MQAFVADGHRVYLLTQTPEGEYHAKCREFGVYTFAHNLKKKNSSIFFLRSTLFLIRFCRRNQIDLVYAHLENAGLPAVLAQYFIKAKVYTCRHIVDEATLMESHNFERLNKIVYSLSKHILVVSQRSKKWMVEKEGIQPKKIQVIPLAYNFSLFDQADPHQVQNIRKQYPAKLLLLTACRMMKGKRPDLGIDLSKQLIREGRDVKLILLGTGPMLPEIQQKIKHSGLEGHVFTPGFKSNVMDYLSACDLLIHPSLQDSSSVIIKEAGLCNKPVMCCREIGDVDEYLSDQNNALLVSRNITLEDMLTYVRKFYENPMDYKEIGINLNRSVKNRFAIEEIIPEYRRIHAGLENHEKN